MENEILVTFEQAQELNKLFKSMGVEFPTLWRYWWVEKTDTLFIVDSSISMKCEVYIKKNCSRCGLLLVFADNSPVYSVFEELSHKSATYNSVLYWKRWTKLI